MKFILISVLLSAHCGLTFAAEPVTNSVGMKLMPIQSGTFTMGQDGPPQDDFIGQKRTQELYKAFNQSDYDEKPAHKVTITQPFLMGVTEVTVGQYRQFDPSYQASNPKRHPARHQPKSLHLQPRVDQTTAARAEEINHNRAMRPFITLLSRPPARAVPRRTPPIRRDPRPSPTSFSS